MKKLIYQPVEERHADDVSRIVGACARWGYEISPQNAEDAWREYSLNLTNGSVWWVHLPDDDFAVFRVMQSFCKEIGGDE